MTRFRFGDRVLYVGEVAKVVAIEEGLLRSYATVEFLTGVGSGTRIRVDEAYLQPAGATQIAGHERGEGA